MTDSLLARGPRRAAEPEPQKEGYEPGRLRRAAQLAVKRLGPAQFAVKGQDEPFYRVDLSADVPCYCKDAEFHGKGCKHYLASRMANGDMGLLLALGQMLVETEKRLEEVTRANRRKNRTVLVQG